MHESAEYGGVIFPLTPNELLRLWRCRISEVKTACSCYLFEMPFLKAAIDHFLGLPLLLLCSLCVSSFAKTLLISSST
jgi:hypothetical protein